MCGCTIHWLTVKGAEDARSVLGYSCKERILATILGAEASVRVPSTFICLLFDPVTGAGGRCVFAVIHRSVLFYGEHWCLRKCLDCLCGHQFHAVRDISRCVDLFEYCVYILLLCNF